MKILIIDDEAIRHFGFTEIYPNDKIFKAFNVSEAINLLEKEDIDLIQLDHDLQDFEHFNDGRRPIEHTGMEICSYLIKRGYLGKVIIHSWNTVASLRMKKMFEDANINVSYEPYRTYTLAQNSK